MARTKMVTRTVVQTTADVMRINTSTAEVSIVPFTLGGKYTDGEEFLKAVNKTAYDLPDIKYVKADNLVEEELLLGMTEEEFIRNARVLPPRTKSDIDEE